MGTTGGRMTDTGWQKRRMTKGKRTCGMTYRECIMTTTTIGTMTTTMTHAGSFPYLLVETAPTESRL